MNIIDTYVSEVGRRLPAKQRADIEAEIRSILQDMLDERSQKTGKPIDEEMTLQVLKEYGSPDKVAATYLGERYLIGPRLYPIFMLVLRTGLMIAGIVAAVTFGVAVYRTTLSPVNLFQSLVSAMADFVTVVITVLGNVVLVFAIIEWALYRAGMKGEIKGLPKEKEWDPRSLAKVLPANQIKLAEVIIEIVGSFAAIVLFNFYPQVFGIWIGINGEWYVGAGSHTVIPLLSAAFFYYVPYLTAVWILTIVLDIVLLRLGSWNALARAGLIALKVINIVIAAAMLAGPSLVGVTAAALAGPLGSLEAAHTLVNLLNIVFRVALWLGIFGSAVEIIRALSRLIARDVLQHLPTKN